MRTAALRADADILGLDGRTEIVRAALQLLHRRAAEERMARSVDEFYGDAAPGLPIGVLAPDADAEQPVRGNALLSGTDAPA